MNTLDHWQTTATILDPERKQFWLGAIGTNTLPIKSIVPIVCNLPGRPSAHAYLLDLPAISGEMKRKIAEGIAAKFGVDAGEVEADMERNGMPILADNCSAQSSDPAVFALLL